MWYLQQQILLGQPRALDRQTRLFRNLLLQGVRSQGLCPQARTCASSYVGVVHCLPALTPASHSLGSEKQKSELEPNMTRE